MSELLGIARFRFHEGKLEEFKRLSAQAREIVRSQDTGTLQYEASAELRAKLAGSEFPVIFTPYQSM